jgi:2-amino-4-hydroxy-6-hydroxymethyldihydropteridine diphosphokinase
MNAVAVTAYVGLGGNLNDPRTLLLSAIDALRRLPRTRQLRCSSFYRSAPVGNTRQPDFINAACRLETTLPAGELMRALLDIEHAHGRVRDGTPGGPRTLDLDLLLYGDETLREPGLVVPHPRMHERAFVLAPLTELDPAGHVPGRGPFVTLLAACEGQRIDKLPVA